MAKKGQRVMIISNTDKSIRSRARNNYIGHTGEVTGIFGDYGYYMLMKFDDDELESKNHWIWNDAEVLILDEDNKNFVR